MQFVNPYNFVPLTGKVPRRRPESHEYFVGNRGRIVARITFKTPFFIPHPERRFRLPGTEIALALDNSALPKWVRERAHEAWQALKQRIQQARTNTSYSSEGHEMLALLRDHEEKPFIPGSSLKGAFRTVAEALSNSCLSQLEFEWELQSKPEDPEVRISKVKRYYSYRRVRSPQGVGIVESLPENDRHGEIKIQQKAKVFFRNPQGVQDYREDYCQNLTGYQDGQKIWAKIISLWYYRRRIQFQAVARLSNQGGENLRCGRLKITEVTGAKKSQRFIYNPCQEKRITFSKEVHLKYNRAIESSLEGNSGHKPCQDPRAGQRSFRHYLQQNDIVYFTEENGQVIDMGPVELYRVLYKHSLDEILLNKHKDFLPCQKIDELCPACRIFGWVAPHGQVSSEGDNGAIALKGFVHFSPARWVGNQKPKTQWVTLQPLGQPHPSCWQFYLHCQNSSQQTGYDNAGYNDDHASIRGRKFYWHKPQVTAEKPDGQANINSVWDQRGGNGRSVPDDQNKTVELLLPEGAVFEFTVDFENLSDADLGLLLLTLQPNLLGGQALSNQGFSEHLYHHFGMGKPLGLGSAEVQIVSLTLYDSAERYQDLFATGAKCYQPEDKAFQEQVKKFVMAFVRESLKEQGRPTHNNDDQRACQEFLNMPHIKILFIMLDWEKAQDLPISYPPGSEDSNQREFWEAFRWFVHSFQRGNNRKEMLLKPEEVINGRRQSFPPLQSQQRQQRRR